MDTVHKTAMACHDQGKQAINLTLSVPRNAWTPIPGIPGKIETTVKCDHLGDIAGVAHLDLLGTEHGQVTGMTLHRVEGLPTGATLGVVVGHQDEDKNKFMPLKATETTAHVDMAGDTHIYHAMAVGKSDAGSKVGFAPSDDVANVDQITAKIERWSHADPEDVQYQSFTGTNAKGQTKSVAAIHTSSPLGELIKRNEKNSKFTATTGAIRSVTNDGLDYYVMGAEQAKTLESGLKGALGPQTKWAKHPMAVRLFTDAATMEGTGAHPHNVHLTLHRENAKEVADNRDSGDTSGALIADTVVSDMLAGADASLAKAVFEGEDSVVKIASAADDGGE